MDRIADARGTAALDLVTSACRCLEENLDGRLTLEALGKRVGSSPYHLQRTFKRVLGVTPRQFADARRMERLKQNLREGERVTESVYGVGYGSTSRLYERASGHFGMAPSRYRRGGDGEKIRYATRHCSLGQILVAATDAGICFIGLGEHEEDLEPKLRHEFPSASVARDEGSLTTWLDAIVRYVDGRQSDLDLPLDVRATAFERRVWEELQRIPYGETRSYREVAEAIGQPKAARAVGNACANNPAALIVPCHRVVRSDGRAGNYGWGTERKERLLAQEKAGSANKKASTHRS